jgi:hypothetical protein
MFWTLEIPFKTGFTVFLLFSTATLRDRACKYRKYAALSIGICIVAWRRNNGGHRLLYAL